MESEFDILNKELNQLEDKIRLLALTLASERAENKSLKEQLADLNQVNQYQKKQIKELTTNDKLVKLADVISVTWNSDEDLKSQIDNYIEELTKCIALLSE